jgi:glycosyltransferase involved in cell wall biosynthesis
MGNDPALEGVCVISVVTPTKKINNHVRHNQALLERDARVEEYLVIEGLSPVSKARQRGLESAQGEYILWLDSDIELRENPIDIFMALLEKGGVSGYSLTVPNTMANIFKRVHEEVNFNRVPDFYESTVCLFECGIFERAKMMEVGGFDREMRAGEDNYMAMKLRKAGYPCYKTKRVVVDHYYDSRNLGEKQRGYGWGVQEVKNIFGEEYSIFESPPMGLVEKWRLRMKALRRLGKLHLLPFLPLYNLYVGQMFRRGMRDACCK